MHHFIKPAQKIHERKFNTSFILLMKAWGSEVFQRKYSVSSSFQITDKSPFSVSMYYALFETYLYYELVICLKFKLNWTACFCSLSSLGSGDSSLERVSSLLKVILIVGTELMFGSSSCSEQSSGPDLHGSPLATTVPS